MPFAIAAGIGAAALSYQGAKKQAAATERAARESAAAQRDAANIAASAGAFRPVGISTRFGTSQFQMGTDQYGNPIVTGAGYTPSAETQDLQARIASMYGPSLGLAEQAMPQAQRLFNLGAGYLAESPEAAQSRVFQQLQDIGATQRAEEEARLGASVFGRGRAGVNVGGIQPELYGLARAREEQRARDALTARQVAQQDISFGTGLMSQAYALPGAALSPFQAQYGLVSGLEAQAMQPLELGAALGGRNVNPYGAAAQFKAGAQGAADILRAQQGGIAARGLAEQNLMNTFFNKLGIGQTGGSQYAPEGMGSSPWGGGSWQAPAPIIDRSIYGSMYGNMYTNPSGMFEAGMAL